MFFNATVNCIGSFLKYMCFNEMSIVATLRGTSDLKKGAQGRVCDQGTSYTVCSPCGNSSSYTLKIMYFYVYYTLYFIEN